MPVKFSDFVNGGVLKVGDKTVGLRSGVNTQFDDPSNGVKDQFGNYMLQYSSTATTGPNATNYPLIIANGITGFVRATYTADGPNTDIDINILAKGNGRIFLGSSDNSTTTSFYINGSQGINFINSDSAFTGANNNNLSTSLAIKTYVDNTASGLVHSVTGTTNRITISGTSSNPIVDIASNYIGQTSLTTLGTITSGSWNGSTISVSYGGTGTNTFNAYSLICGGTSPTSSLQSLSSTGTNGQILRSNGSSSLPTWESISSSGAITSINGDSGSISPSSGIISIQGGSSGVLFSGSGSTLSASFATIGGYQIFANSTSSFNPPTSSSLTSIIDGAMGNTQGSLLYRNNSVWTTLAPSTSGYILQTNGTSSNPSWVSQVSTSTIPVDGITIISNNYSFPIPTQDPTLLNGGINGVYQISGTNYTSICHGGTGNSFSTFSFNGNNWVFVSTVTAGNNCLASTVYNYIGVYYLVCTNKSDGTISVFSWSGTNWVQVGVNTATGTTLPSFLTSFLITQPYICVACANTIVYMTYSSLSSSYSIVSTTTLTGVGQINSFFNGSTQYVIAVSTTANTLNLYSASPVGLTPVQLGISLGSSPNNICPYMLGSTQMIAVSCQSANAIYLFSFNGSTLSSFGSPLPTLGSTLSGVAAYNTGGNDYLLGINYTSANLVTYKYNGSIYSQYGGLSNIDASSNGLFAFTYSGNIYFSYCTANITTVSVFHFINQVLSANEIPIYQISPLFGNFYPLVAFNYTTQIINPLIMPGYYYIGANQTLYSPNIQMALTTTVTSAITVTLNTAATRYQVFNGSTTEIVKLPPPNATYMGSVVEIINTSTGVVTVNSSGGNLVQAMASNTKLVCLCIANLTTAAAWVTTYSVINGSPTPISMGGTGQTTANAGFNALSPMTTAGDLIYGGASGVATRLATGSGVLVGGSTPSYSTTPTLTGTNFSSIPNSALVNSAITINGTAISLGGSGTVTAAAGTLTGTTLNSTVVNSSLQTFGTISAAVNNTNFAANSGTAITINPANGTYQTITLTGNCTITMGTTPTGVIENELIIQLVQDATGGRTVSWVNINFATNGGVPPTVNSAIGASTYIGVSGTVNGWIGYAAYSGLGVTSGASATTGYIGEILTSSVASGSAVSLTTATVTPITSINYTAGNWLVIANPTFIGTGITGTELQALLATASGTSTTGQVTANTSYSDPFSATTTGQATAPIMWIFNTSSGGTLYLKAKSTFTVGSCTAYGALTMQRYM